MPLGGVSQGTMPALGFECQFCHRSFGTKRGLEVHQHSLHPNEYQEKFLDELNEKGEKETKKRWSDIEVSRMAKEEARILHTRGQITNINEELKKVLPGRSIEGIERKRTPDK